MKAITAYCLVMSTAVFLLASCGEQMSDGEYFSALNQIASEDQAREEGLGYPFDSPFDADDAKLGAAKTYIASMGAIQDSTINDVERLVPPVFARNANASLLNALRAIRALWRELELRAADSSSALEVNRLLFEFPERTDVRLATEQFDARCSELQSLATQNRVDIDLGC